MKRILFTQSRPPHGGISAQEGLDAILMGSAFAECAGLFQGDGVYQLLKHQQPERLGTKNFASTFGALADYGVDQIFCIDEDLEKRQLGTDELVIPTIPIKQNTVCEFISAFDLVLDF